jgi:hypothetical protein
MKTTLRNSVFLLLFFSTMIKTQAQVTVPIMNSYPSPVPSTIPTIFLDFDGHTITGTSWNGYVSGLPIYAAASTLDTAAMRQIFNRVAEDFKPFLLNVTTDSTRFYNQSTTRRQRVILTNSYQWFDPAGGAGGVANLNTFSSISDDPCFVFTSLLQNHVKSIAEATSHETGHTLGLFHQANWNTSCNLVSEYHYGQGDGEISWAPIMGVGYYKNVTTWNIGPDPYGCNRVQRDADVITKTANGITYRPDDIDSTFANAFDASFVSDQLTLNGEIGSSYDKDMIKFTLAALKRVRIDVLPFSVGAGNAGSNLDIQVNLYNNSEVLLRSYNPENLLSTSIDTTLPQGTYYLRVQGIGNANVPEFASMGTYIVNGQLSDAGTLPLRILRLMGTTSAGKHNLSWLIDADEQIVSQVLEVSEDGRNYVAVSSFADAATRNHSYKPTALNNTLLYRLNVTFNNGKQYYSNIVAIKQTGNIEIPKLVNKITNSNVVIITSPAVFDYAIYDLSGKSVAKGRLSAGINNVNISSNTSGIYFVRFIKDGEQWTDKFIRQ